MPRKSQKKCSCGFEQKKTAAASKVAGDPKATKARNAVLNEMKKPSPAFSKIVFKHCVVTKADLRTKVLRNFHNSVYHKAMAAAKKAGLKHDVALAFARLAGHKVRTQWQVLESKSKK